MIQFLFVIKKLVSRHALFSLRICTKGDHDDHNEPLQSPMAATHLNNSRALSDIESRAINFSQSSNCHPLSSVPLPDAAPLFPFFIIEGEMQQPSKAADWSRKRPHRKPCLTVNLVVFRFGARQAFDPGYSPSLPSTDLLSGGGGSTACWAKNK